MADAAQKSLPASIVVNGITLHKMTLSETARAMKHMRGLPQLFGALQVSKDADILEVIPLIGDFMPDALEILAISAHMTVAELDEQLEIAEAVECFLAVFKVNDFLSVGERIGKAMAPLAEKPATKK